jgi:hypothetical protein
MGDLCGVSVQIHRGPDEEGRYSHTRHWCQDHPSEGNPDPASQRCRKCGGYRRGQVFLAALPPEYTLEPERARRRPAEASCAVVEPPPVPLPSPEPDQAPTRVCTKCRRRKPVAAFPKDSGKRDGLNSHCKSCRAQVDHDRREGLKTTPRLTPEDLRCRPIEHILEALTVKQLAAAWQVSKDTASIMRTRPWAVAGTEFEVNDARDRQLRSYLETVTA